MKLLRRFTQRGIVLLNEVPSNLVLGEVIAGSTASAGLSKTRGGRVLLGCTLVLVLLREATIGRHRACGFEE
jgi:hypothetical protein